MMYFQYHDSIERFGMFQNITITFQSTFEIESDNACAYDYVKIYTDGGRETHGNVDPFESIGFVLENTSNTIRSMFNHHLLFPKFTNCIYTLVYIHVQKV